MPLRQRRNLEWIFSVAQMHFLVYVTVIYIHLHRILNLTWCVIYLWLLMHIKVRWLHLKSHNSTFPNLWISEVKWRYLTINNRFSLMLPDLWKYNVLPINFTLTKSSMIPTKARHFVVSSRILYENTLYLISLYICKTYVCVCVQNR